MHFLTTISTQNALMNWKSDFWTRTARHIVEMAWASTFAARPARR